MTGLAFSGNYDNETGYVGSYKNRFYLYLGVTSLTCSCNYDSETCSDGTCVTNGSCYKSVKLTKGNLISTLTSDWVWRSRQIRNSG